MLTPAAGQTTSLKPPTNPVGYWSDVATNGALLSSSVVEYSDKWGNQCDPIDDYSLGTPVDSLGTPVDSTDGENRDCSPLAEFVTDFGQYLDIELKNYNGQGDYTLDGFNWLELKDSLIECEQCLPLFSYYAEYFLVDDIEAYGMCENGEFNTDEDGIEFVTQCDFLNSTSNIHMRSDATFNVNELIRESGNTENCTKPDWTVYSNFRRQFRTTETQSRLVIEEECPIWSSNDDQNPYLTGRRGNWRPAATYVAKQAERNISTIHPNSTVTTDARENDYSQPLIYRDGTFSDYLPFWHQGSKLNAGNSHQLTYRILRYDEHGHELETLDALGIASGAQYGFNQQLPTAVAQNARVSDLGYDSFEDYQFKRGATTERWRRHFGMLGREVAPNQYENGPSRDAAHTGKYSYETQNGGAGLVQSFTTYSCSGQVGSCPEESECPCLSEFSPTTDQRYLVTAWIASDVSLDFGQSPARLPGATGPPNANTAARLLASTTTNSGSTSLGTAYPAGPVVEGWQQVQLEFLLPMDATELSLSLTPPGNNTGDTYSYFFDDIRIQPYEADMTTYAYDPTTLRLMAQMDDRGYAVFYEYDDEGMLIRQKRETERGVMTITEQHTNLAPATKK